MGDKCEKKLVSSLTMLSLTLSWGLPDGFSLERNLRKFCMAMLKSGKTAIKFKRLNMPFI